MPAAFLSVYLPEGEHTLEFRYIPEGFKTGCILFGGCLLLLTLSLWSRKRKKRSIEKEEHENA